MWKRERKTNVYALIVDVSCMHDLAGLKTWYCTFIALLFSIIKSAAQTQTRAHICKDKTAKYTLSDPVV